MGIFSPPEIQSYTNYYQNLLSTAGVLFGLTFTGLLYVIQSGFSTFKYSRRMFLEIYVIFGKKLLLSLAYLTVISIFYLNFKFKPLPYTIAYMFFAFIYTKWYLDHFQKNGYMKTIFSNKFVPAGYSKFRAYFRYITNLGLPTVISLLFLFFVLIIYPIIVSYEESSKFLITEKGLFYSTLIILLHSIFVVTQFIPNLFELSNQEIKYKSDLLDESKNDRMEQKNANIQNERELLKLHFIKHGVREIEQPNSTNFLDGEISLNLLIEREGSDVFFISTVNIKNQTPFKVRREIEKYAIKILEIFSDSKVEINQIILSFMISASGETEPRNIFIRSDRSELKEVLKSDKSAKEMISLMKNVFMDDLFKNI